MTDKFEEWLEKEKKALVSADIIPAGEETRTTALMILNRVSDKYCEFLKELRETKPIFHKRKKWKVFN